jgi:hypothetical protein
MHAASGRPQRPVAERHNAVMPYRLQERDPDSAVRELTLVPFQSDGTCIAVRAAGGRLYLPTGSVQPAEDWLLDACLRIPMMTAGFRTQRVHPFAIDGRHLYVWIDGDRYIGPQPHIDADWYVAGVEDVAAALAAQGHLRWATAVRDAGRSFAGQDDASYYADNVRLLEPAYLRGDTPQGGSGSGATAHGWRRGREMIVDAIDRDGTFLDLGCANGLLMDSVRKWAAERGYAIEPYGVDLAPRLVALARQRLPHWADRIEVGNAISWTPVGGRRFTFVHLLEDTVPAKRRRELVEHARAVLVEPGGRVLLSRYRTAPGPGAADLLSELGYQPTGQSVAPTGRHSTAWLDAAPIG